MSCTCGNTAPTEECCGPIINGSKKAETAEALMRSRYSAYALGEVDHIVASHDPKTVQEVDREGAQAWSSGATWDGLEILDTVNGGPDDQEGEVEFIARYSGKGQQFTHHERALFRRIEGDWFYIDGEIIKPKPVVRETPKVGRNEPCPCGSGKKYKKCCG